VVPKGGFNYETSVEKCDPVSSFLIASVLLPYGFKFEAFAAAHVT